MKKDEYIIVKISLILTYIGAIFSEMISFYIGVRDSLLLLSSILIIASLAIYIEEKSKFIGEK